MPRRPRSLYVHVPFCERKCPYCAFNSHAGASGDAIGRYVDALLKELSCLPAPLELETIYVGGGTPTALPAESLRRLTRAIGDSLATRVREWTVEINPGTATTDRLSALLDGGVNRISMGVQSMNPRRLRRLGRIHTAEDVCHTVETLHDAGLRNINLDLIYGQPEQDLAEWMYDVEAILAQGPEHISLYALQFEEGTPYGRAHEEGRLTGGSEDLVLEMFHVAREALSREGFHLYELSNFAQSGRESRHNQTYWRNEAYFGIGAGAYSCVDGERRQNENDPDRYAEMIEEQGNAVIEREILGPRETYLETLAAGLRTTEGVDLVRLRERTALDVEELHGEHVRQLVDRGLAQKRTGRLSLTTEGLWVLDTVMEPFLDGLSEVATSA